MLEESKRLGFLGPGRVVDHINHSARFLPPLDRAAATLRRTGNVDRTPAFRLLDLGAGGGVPSLPILLARPEFEAVMIDASQRRCSFLTWTLGRLGLTDRVEVWCGRAEALAHEDRARFGFDAVVARGFGPPATTVECGAPFLVEDGYLIISEPPERRRWPVGPLTAVGLTEIGSWPGVVTLQRTGSVDPRYPRRAKAQQRTPLF